MTYNEALKANPLDPFYPWYAWRICMRWESGTYGEMLTVMAVDLHNSGFIQMELLCMDPMESQLIDWGLDALHPLSDLNYLIKQQNNWHAGSWQQLVAYLDKERIRR